MSCPITSSEYLEKLLVSFKTELMKQKTVKGDEYKDIIRIDCILNYVLSLPEAI